MSHGLSGQGFPGKRFVNFKTSVMEMLNRLEENFEIHLERLKDFVAIPSVSTDPQYEGDIRRACEWVRDQALAAGLTTEVREPARHPAVVAHNGFRQGCPICSFMATTMFSPQKMSRPGSTLPFSQLSTTDISTAAGRRTIRGRS